MVCSEKELGISDNRRNHGFADDAPVGVPLRDYLGDTILTSKSLLIGRIAFQ